MPYHNILSKLDRALVAYLVSLNAGTEEDVFPAKRDQEKVIPNTVCVSENFREEPSGSGNFLVSASIHVRTSAALDVDGDSTTIQEESEDRVQATFDAFHPGGDEHGEQLAAAITAAGSAEGVNEFTAFWCRVKGGDRAQAEKGYAWIDTLELEVYCAPSDIN
jgi:hypothetical protein